MSVVDYNPWGVAWEIDKAAGQKAYRTAQNAAMWVNSKRAAGGSDASSTTPTTTSTAPAKKGSGKQWSTDERYQSTTYVNTTTWSKKTK